MSPGLLYTLIGSVHLLVLFVRWRMGRLPSVDPIEPWIHGWLWPWVWVRWAGRLQ